MHFDLVINTEKPCLFLSLSVANRNFALMSRQEKYKINRASYYVIDNKQQQQLEMTMPQSRALKAIQECLLRQRYYAMRSLSTAGKQYLYDLADVAHNLPLALSGDDKCSIDQPYFLESLEKLESLLSQPVPNPSYLA